MDPTALGRYLRESRESRELTLEDAVRALRIRRDILESFEQGEFAILDSSVRVRGMLRNYAKFLDLEEERVLQYYEASLDSKRRRRRFGQREPHAEPIAARNITDTPPSLPAVTLTSSSDTGGLTVVLRNLAMLLVSLAAIAVIIYVVMDTLERSTPPTEAALVATVSGSVTITPTNTATITPRATIIPETPDAFALGIVGVQVMLEMQQRSWVRISVDDVESYVGFLEPGNSITYEANNNVTIVAANAAALDIVYNAIPQESFGTRGQQVELIFTTSGVDVTQGDGIIPTEAVPTTPAAPIATTVAPITQSSQTTTSSSVANNVPTATLSGIITPTPLFRSDTSTPTSAPISNVTATTAQSAITATQSTQADAATNLPASTPTRAVVLPERATSVNPTPTKTG